MNKSADPKIDALALTRFIKGAKEQLAAQGEDDAAHYFEMIEEHLRATGSVSSDARKISQILGL